MPYFLKRSRFSISSKLNITPLIDINANLLFFLMINASVQEDRLDAGKEVDLPESNARTAEAGDLISVVLAMDFVSINEREVMKLDAGKIDPKSFNEKRNRVVPVYQHLTKEFEELLQEGAQPGAADSDNKLPVIFVQADRRLPYQTVAKVMRACGQAGFTRFRFAATEVRPKDILNKAEAP